MHSLKTSEISCYLYVFDMARKEKKIYNIEGVDRRKVGYYSTPLFVAEYLTRRMLEIKPNGSLVLDPAVGKEELISGFSHAGVSIESYDVMDFGEHALSRFHHRDFIEEYMEWKKEQFFDIPFNNDYDYIIANPPYNCHEVDYIQQNKERLKSFFPIGTYNMYSMFLYAMIDIAKDGCIIGVIVSDSFLTASAHSKLRQYILDNCAIHDLILCPSNLFAKEQADVRTCILILEKGRNNQQKIRVCNRPKSINDLKKVLANDQVSLVSIDDICLSNNTSLNQFIVDVDPQIISLFTQSPSLGSLYQCLTCISTGNDKKYLSTNPKAGFTVPFYKNPASKRFVGSPDAYLIDNYIEESYRVKDFMVRNKNYVGKKGIACSSMGLPFGAVLLPEGSVTGVNPTIFVDDEDLYWLLSYLNSSLVTYLVRGVLIRSNMVTSGYIAKLPIIKLSNDERRLLASISIEAIRGTIDCEEAVQRIDSIIFTNMHLTKTVSDNIIRFRRELYQRV